MQFDLDVTGRKVVVLGSAQGSRRAVARFVRVAGLAGAARPEPARHVVHAARAAARARRLAEIAARHDLVVVSDEVHAELVHPPHQHVPFASLGEDVAARTVTVTGSSTTPTATVSVSVSRCGACSGRRTG